MNIVYVYADTPSETNCSLFNCQFPTEAINKTEGNHADIIHIDEFKKRTDNTKQLCSNADIIIVERNLYGETLSEMMYWKAGMAKNVAVIFDDAYHIILSGNASYQWWHDGKVVVDHEGKKILANFIPHPMEQFKWGLRMSKGIITPSRILSDDWKDYAPTYRTYNYLKPERYVDRTPLFSHPKEEIYIGWSGSMSHYESFTDSGIAGALAYVSNKYPNVKILMTGDRKVYDRINIASSRKVFSSYVPEEKWSSLLCSLDIGLAPLATDFDRRRSWIKVLEYMILKIPWIASNYETYEELGEYGTLVENTLVDWKKALCDTIDHIEEKRALANGKAYDFAMTQTWDGNIHKLLAIFQQIIDSKYW